jgi:hypothetical protein
MYVQYTLLVEKVPKLQVQDFLFPFAISLREVAQGFAITERLRWKESVFLYTLLYLQFPNECMLISRIVGSRRSNMPSEDASTHLLYIIKKK